MISEVVSESMAFTKDGQRFSSIPFATSASRMVAWSASEVTSWVGVVHARHVA